MPLRTTKPYKAFWASLLDDRSQILSRTGASHTLLLGDLRVHLPCMVVHEGDCHCSHCQPSPADRSVASLLHLHGLVYIDPVGIATHVSGSVIDLFITDSPSCLPSPEVLPAAVIISNKQPSMFSLPEQISCAKRIIHFTFSIGSLVQPATFVAAW